MKTQQNDLYENYPLSTVILSNLLSISIYFIGAFILYQVGFASLILYLLYILWLELRLCGTHCIKCYYHGKTCAFGKGRVSALFFKKDKQKFASMQVSWKDILPDFLVSLIPMIAAVILLIKQFNWIYIISIILLAILSFAGSALVRGQIACKHCKQRTLGCPAEKLFNKNKK